MSDEINVGNISHSQNIAIGRNAQVIVYPDYRPDAVYNLPPANPHFVGRAAQLEAIAQNFASAANPLVVTQAIAGLGGVGKTQLALAYAHSRRDQYDMLWLLRASDTPTLINELRLLGITLELFTPEVQDAEVIRTKVLSHLGSSKKRWLLLYDNVDELTPRDLRPYLPGGGHLLITSRRNTAHWQPLGQTLALDTFTEAEAMAFWQERKLPDAPELAVLAQELGHLPLAMEQAAAFMQVQQLPAADYLAWFREARDSLWAEEEPPADYPKTVATTWQICFEYARKCSGAAELLNLCCFLNPDAIPLDLIIKLPLLKTKGLLNYFRLFFPGLRQLKRLQNVIEDERKLHLAVTALHEYSLLSRANGMLRLHRLVQMVARDRMGKNLARAWVKITLALLRKVYYFDLNDVRTWEEAGHMLPHLTASIELAGEFDCKTRNAAYLNNEVGLYVKSQGNFKTALPFFKRALSIRENVFGPNHPYTAQSLNNLGLLLKSMGELNASRPYLERALKINKKALGPDHPITANSLNSLGSLLQSIGDRPAAQSYLEQSLKINREKLGPDHPFTATNLNNLGGFLQSGGDLPAALPYFEHALNTTEKVFGPDHPDTATSLSNLGVILQDLGDLTLAQTYLERALAIRENILGADHPETVESLNNLAVLLAHQGEFERAIPLMRRVLTISEEKLGSNHPTTQMYRRSVTKMKADAKK